MEVLARAEWVSGLGVGIATLPRKADWNGVMGIKNKNKQNKIV